MESQPMNEEPAVDRFSEQEIQSRSGSSIDHPRTQFPLYDPTTPAAYQPALFARSLLSLGHGFPPWRPGAKGLPTFHLEKGVSIGDVGFMGIDGNLRYSFNVFYPADHPIQPAVLPRNFRPIEPPLADWKKRTVNDRFERGTILTSAGLNLSRQSQDPLEIDFTSSAREGACIILPEGAIREDLEEVHKLFPYIKEHASDWYEFLNDYSDIALPAPVVNGTLFIVTGTDRTPHFTSALFPTEESERRTRTSFKYRAKSLKDRKIVQTRSVTSNSERLTSANGEFPSAIFLRGLTIALSQSVWNHGLAPIPLERLPLYYIPSIPPLGTWTRIMAKLKAQVDEDEDEEHDYNEAIFHPAILILQILLDMTPDADVAIVEDTVWCSFMEGRTVTVPEIIRLISLILDNFNATFIDGVGCFTQASKDPVQVTLKETIQSWVRFLLTGSVRPKPQQEALRKLKRLLTKQSLDS